MAVPERFTLNNSRYDAWCQLLPGGCRSRPRRATAADCVRLERPPRCIISIQAVQGARRCPRSATACQPAPLPVASAGRSDMWHLPATRMPARRHRARPLRIASLVTRPPSAKNRGGGAANRNSPDYVALFTPFRWRRCAEPRTSDLKSCTLHREACDSLAQAGWVEMLPRRLSALSHSFELPDCVWVHTGARYGYIAVGFRAARAGDDPWRIHTVKRNRHINYRLRTVNLTRGSFTDYRRRFRDGKSAGQVVPCLAAGPPLVSGREMSAP